MCIGQAEDRKFFRKLSLEDCLVLDEGHMLKNMNSLRYTHTHLIKIHGMLTNIHVVSVLLCKACSIECVYILKEWFLML